MVMPPVQLGCGFLELAPIVGQALREMFRAIIAYGLDPWAC